MLRDLVRAVRDRRLRRALLLLLERKGRRLHVGCGDDYIEGCINIDADPESRADLVMYAGKVHLFPDACLESLESYHFFEHLTYYQAVWTLGEWFRILAPGGELLIEMPDLEVCVRELGHHRDGNGNDIALGGIYGNPGEVRRKGIGHAHKWGWTFEAIAGELRKAGFAEIARHPVRQTYRPSTSFDRDMQVRARRPGTRGGTA